MTRSCLQKMTLFFLMMILGLIALSANSFDTELHHRIINTVASSKPYILNRDVVLSYDAPPGTQIVALALENEQYQKFHIYEKNRHGIFILALSVPENLNALRYRLIVDGLWTVDPNAKKQKDNRRILVSFVSIPADSSTPSPGLTRLPDGKTRFVYFGETNSRVSLVGNFNRWDPYLTPMEESLIHPGVYSATLKLPENARFYRFVVNGKDLLDPENHTNAHNGWGETASVINK